MNTQPSATLNRCLEPARQYCRLTQLLQGTALVVLLWLCFWHVSVAEENNTTSAADGLPVSVSITGIKDPLLNNVKGFLEIYSLHGKNATSEPRLKYLHKIAEKQIQDALRPFGYFNPVIKIELTSGAKGWQANYHIEKGEVMKIGKLEYKISGPGCETEKGCDDEEFRKAQHGPWLKAGGRLNQQAYEALKKHLQVLASERGYFDAKLVKNEIRIRRGENTAKVEFHFDTGVRYKFGEVTFKEEKEWIRPRLLNRFNEIKPGDDYDANELRILQGDLSSTDYYESVEIYASPEAADNHTIPVEVRLTPRKPKKYTIGVGYGTDTGARIKGGLKGRRSNRSGHHYSVEALLAEIKYGIAGEYVIPTGDPRSDSVGLRASLEREDSETRSYEAFSIGGYYKYKDDNWVKTYALDRRVEQFDVSGRSPTRSLLIPSVDWTRTFPEEMEKRIFAQSGTWLQLRLRGGSEELLSDTTFIQPLIASKYIYSFKNRHRVIGRAAAGATWVDDFDSLPTSLRYFTGGDRTVRGYKYNVIGPKDNNGEVVGGKNLLEASIQYEVPVKEKWSVAVFADTGDAYDDELSLHSGVGVGLHWRSPIGPVRIDLGHGLDQPEADKLRLHLTIGPDL